MKSFNKIKAIAISILIFGTICIPNCKNENRIVLAENINNDNLSTSNDYIDINNGSISLLYSTGTVVENNGHIDEADGTVNLNNTNGTIGDLLGNCLENKGEITRCSRGKVGTNSGTIDTIDSSGSCTVNEDNCNIYMNIGTIGINYGLVGENYGTINDFRSGTISENKQTGTVTFTNSSIGGTIQKNYGTVVFNESVKQVEITENFGTITINGGKVKVENNRGTILIVGKTDLYIKDNFGSVKKVGEPTYFDCDCVNNYGTVSFPVNSNGITFSTRKDYESIVFIGDDGKAVITLCSTTIDNVNYTSNAEKLQFTLPDGYFCDDKDATRDTENPNLWTIYTRTFVDETEYQVMCHKCHSDDIKNDDNYHWLECDECGNVFNKENHKGDFVSNNDLTCSKDETRTRTCSVCGNKETITIVDSHLDSNKHNPVLDSRVEPTYENTGLSEGSHCADCGKILAEQNEIPCLLDGYVRVIFTGLEQTPIVISDNISCDLGLFVKNNSLISFKLDEDCTCLNDDATNDENNIWTLEVKESDADEFFTIECHKCNFSKECYDNENHWLECSICGRKNNKSLTEHTFCEFTSNGDATCAQDGTKTRKCSNCQYSETVSDVGSSKIANHKNVVYDPKVEPTYENFGLTEGSHCLTCGFVITAQEIIPKLEIVPKENDNTLVIVLSIAIGIPITAGILFGFFFLKHHRSKVTKSK